MQLQDTTDSRRSCQQFGDGQEAIDVLRHQSSPPRRCQDVSPRLCQAVELHRVSTVIEQPVAYSTRTCTFTQFMCHSTHNTLYMYVHVH